MKRILISLIGVLAFFSTNTRALAQEKVYWDVVDNIRQEGFERSNIHEYIWTMTDLFGPRYTASPNMRMTQEWAKTTMDQLGLENTELEPWGDKFASWDLEYVSVHMLDPDYQMVIGYPMMLTAGTDGVVSSEAMIVRILNRDDLDDYRGQLRGKIILVSGKREFGFRSMPDAVRHDEETLRAFETEGRDINMQKRAAEAWWQRDQGPEGISVDEIEVFYKSEGVAVVLYTGRGGDGSVAVSRRPTRRGVRTVQGVNESLPMLTIIPEHYNRIYRLLENGHQVRMQIEVRVNVGEEEVEGRNVIGEIRGSDLSDEIVMIGAHLDSWHSGTGASDNAAGSAVVLEAMRILKAIGVKPRRTIRMGLWSSEEDGHTGSKGYVTNHFGNTEIGTKPAYDKFSVYFNMDNGTGQFRGVHLQENSAAAPIFEAWMTPFNDLKMKTLSRFSNRGTDHLQFDRVGLPGFQFLQDRIDYRTRTWHYNMDTYDHIILDDLKINAVVMASFAYHAAMRADKFPRKANSE